MSYDILSHTATESALLDSLADGQWHPSYKLWKKVNEWVKDSGYKSDNKYTRESMLEELAGLVDNGFLIAGNNESFRFVTKEMEMWRLLSNTLKQDDVRNQPRYFGNILEDDGWKYAPLKPCHLVHFKVAGNIERREIAEFVGVPVASVSVNEDRLYKIYAEDNSDTYDKVQELKTLRPEAKISGIRLESNLKRRNVSELPKRYYSDLCHHYGNFSKVLLRNKMSSITKHLPDVDDQKQQIYIWVIEAVKRYDDSTSIPFAAYLGTALNKWVYDLNRKAYGRSIADAELKYNRVITEFRTRMDREPSTEELAAEMNLSVEEVQKARENISTVVNLRNQKTIDYDDYELPLPAVEMTDRTVEELIEASILSASITTASKEPNNKRNMSGLVGLYYRTWGVDTEDKRIRSWLRSKSVVDSITRISERASVIIQATRLED